ncbi:MAG: SusC/RagA family TonB-linked outer membrane protein [Spirosomataceae bacterium]
MKKNLRIRRIITNVMRITFTQLVLSMIFFGVSLARDGYSQEVLNQKISIRAQEQSVRSVLNQIEKTAEIRFIYSPNLIQSERKVSISLSNSSLNEVLKNLLTPLSIEYRVSGRQIVLKRAENKTPNTVLDETPSIDILEAQENVVTGKITDATGEAVVGVSIQIKGTNKGTTSDAKGEFRINVENKNAVLIFTFIGYTTQEIKVGNQTNIKVVLQADEKILDEVVVVGYGTQKKENLTGAVSTIDSKVIENRPVSNVANALQGVTSGLIITRGSGQPGSEGIGIQIRGVTSANGNVEPLLLVDGVTVPSFTLQTLNPNDIENISVLKDAAAAAIYGAQAAGGVILVTTKKGKSGKTVFDYSTQIATDWALNVPERMPLLEEAEYANLARKNAGSGPEYNEQELQRIRDGVPYVLNPSDTTRYIFYNQEDLISQVVRKYSPMQSHNFSARGGTEKLNYLLSFGYYGKQGAFKVGPDRLDRYNVRFNVGSQLTKHLSLDSRISYTLQQQQAPSSAVDGQNLLYQVYRLRMRYPIFTPEGRLNGGAGSSANNTYALLKEGGYNNIDRNFFDGVFTLTAGNFIKGLKLKAVVGKQLRFANRERFARLVELWGRFTPIFYLNNPNSYTVTNEITNNTNLQFLADYDFTYAKHKFHILGGYQWEDSRFESVSTTANSLVSNDQPTLNLGNDLTKSNSETINTYAFQSYFSRFNYNYADKYLFEATVRVDESSRLAPGLRTKFFPSASAGWNLHRENWFAKSLPFFSEFKLRGSWGRLGNALGIGFYDYLSLLTRGSGLVLGGPEARTSFFFENVVPSSALSWETIETSNAGIDFGLFKNKLQVSGDYYVKFNRNMLTPLQLPATFGVGTPRINNGELKSWGWELEAKYRDKIGKEFSYNVGFNVSDNQNKLISYAGRRVLGAGRVNLLEGYPLNTFWGYIADGYFQTEDEVKAHAFQDSRTGPGDIRFVDQNGDGRLTVGKGSPEDPGDLIYLGTDQPRYIFGLNLGMQYKGFDFTVFVQGVGKRSFLPNGETLQPLSQSWKQPLTFHRDYWTPENPNAAFPRPYLQGAFRYLPSDKWLMNGQYARLKNIQFGYSIPEKVLKKVKLTRARIFFSGQDILTLSRLGIFKNYFDPEQRDNVDNDYPFFGTAAVGLNLSF